MNKPLTEPFAFMNIFSLQTYWHKSACIYEEKDLMNVRMFTMTLFVTEDNL